MRLNVLCGNAHEGGLWEPVPVLVHLSACLCLSEYTVMFVRVTLLCLCVYVSRLECRLNVSVGSYV